MEHRFQADRSPATLIDDSTGEVIGKIDFRRDADGRFLLDYLWVDPARRGQGLARRTLDHFADHVRAEGQKLTAYCGVARSMLSGDARYEDLL